MDYHIGFVCNLQAKASSSQATAYMPFICWRASLVWAAGLTPLTTAPPLLGLPWDSPAATLSECSVHKEAHRLLWILTHRGLSR